MPKIKPIRQHDSSDCGAACLASVAGYHGLNLPLARIRDYASTGTSGTNILGLTEAAEQMGLTAKGVKGPFEALPNAPLPSIAHVITSDRMQHFMVVSSVRKKYIRCMDPACGKFITLSHDEFQRIWTGVLVILAPGTDFTKGSHTQSKVSRMIDLVKPFRKVIFQALFGALVYSLLGLSTAIYVQKIMDHVLVNRNMNLLNLMSLAMVFLLLLRNGIGFLKNLFLLKTGHQIDGILLMSYYRHLLSLPQRFFDNMKTGEILSRMGDAVKIRHFINQSVVDLGVSVTSILLTLLAMSVLSLKLCLLVSSAIPVYAIIFLLYDRFNRVILRKTMEKAAVLESHMVESVSLSRTVREFNLQKTIFGKTENHFISFLQCTYHAGRAAIRSNQTTELVSGLLTIGLLWSGSYQVSNQSLTPGELMSFYAMLGYLLTPLATLTGSSRAIRDAGIAADRLFQIMDLEEERNSNNGIQLRNFKTGLEFRDVDFRYGSRPLLFQNLNFAIPCGAYFGIAGNNGSGKSSLAALMMALYPPRKGKILLDGFEIGQLNKADLRKMVSIVPQHPDLFSGTLLENIAPGEDTPDMEKIQSLVQATGLQVLLEKLPEGLLSTISERGFSLSGGERQRLAIVRALYRDPDILIMDEATSALDPVSEFQILKLLNERLSKGLTLVMISHKIRSIMRADRVLFLDKGQVVEQGTHDELILLGGKYAHYWELQNG